MKGEGCGFLIEYKGQRIYFAGDTTNIKEMEELKDIDTAILPICDNIYAISTEEIIKAVKIIRPKLFIPVHFTPIDEPDPVVKEGMFATKDPRFFTRKQDPRELLQFFEGIDITVAILKKLAKWS